MISEEILSLVKERCGVEPANASYYTKINEWESWWRGYNRPFHEFTENSAGGAPVQRQLYRMNMAKKICEDWASLLLNDNVRITVDDELGEKFVTDVMANNDFIESANKLVEKAFAVGTGAVILRIDGEESVGGALLPETCDLSFEWVDAAHIIPISVKNGRITEAAFVSEGIVRGNEYVYLETHTLTPEGYVIYNDFFLRGSDGTLTLSSSDGLCSGEVHTMSTTPLFAILTPNIRNNVDESSGLGVPVYVDAIDCLKGVDLAFNNFCRDIKLGGKKVFINQSLVQRDEYGNIFTPDDVAQQLFVTIGDTDLSDRMMITEHNPELRTAENAQAVQAQLNYLSFRCGLGTHHYVFDEGRGGELTATQYMGERQDMRQNTVKHQKNVAAFLKDTVRAMLWYAADVLMLPIDKNAGISVVFDDSYFTDSESRRARDLDELKAGIITIDEFRSKWIRGDIYG